jgi:hypothetical protein
MIIILTLKRGTSLSVTLPWSSRQLAPWFLQISRHYVPKASDPATILYRAHNHLRSSHSFVHLK